MNNQIRNEEQAEYIVGPVSPELKAAIANTEDGMITQALDILKSRLREPEMAVKNSPDAENYLKLKLAPLEHEVFAVMFLDNRHQLIEYEEMFRGTIDGASVYPREVVKRALQLNAAALIVSHNHPSGVAEPSMADERITIRLKDACKLVEIRLLDHIVVGGMETVSLAARGVL